MKIGLVGFPGSGKTSVFNALTGLAAETGFAAARGRTNLGTVKVPDARIDALSAIYKPKKTTYAEVTFTDVAAGGSGRALDPATLAAMRDADALCQVVRAFDDPARPEAAPRPLGEAQDLESEMALADLAVIEKRLEVLKKGGKPARPREAELLGRMRLHLEAGSALRSLDLAEEEWAGFSGFAFLSRKPLLLVHNADESAVAAPPPADLAAHARERGVGLVVLSAQVEQEIAELPLAEQADFARSLGLAEPARTRFLHAAFALLDLISFLTTGPDEVRAWPIRRGTPAVRAAGKIHSDIERGFIRAEVIAYDDFARLGSEAKCKEAGKFRMEGKEYRIADGDIVNFRFNV
jgi:GTP-binding protein YchF